MAFLYFHLSYGKELEDARITFDKIKSRFYACISKMFMRQFALVLINNVEI